MKTKINNDLDKFEVITETQKEHITTLFDNLNIEDLIKNYDKTMAKYMAQVLIVTVKEQPKVIKNSRKFVQDVT